MSKMVLITGATSGFGVYTLQHLLDTDHKVYVIARNPSKVDSDLKTNPKLTFVQADLKDLHSIVSSINDIPDRVSFDLLINNAGIMSFDRENTEDGFESTYQVNLLAPYLIIQLLKNRMKPGAKIINTVSALHQGNINFEDLQFEHDWSMLKSYRQSKLGLILLTRLLTQESENISYYSQHPGVIRTNLAQRANWISKTIFWMIGKSTEKGAETLNFLIDTPNDKLSSVEYYDKKKVKKITPQSYDMDVARKLRGILSEHAAPFL